MQPFGLLNFIKTAIQAAETLTPSEGGNAPSSPDSLDAPASSNAPPAPQNKEKEREDKATNAFLSFCEQHDKRAKRLRK